MVSQITQNCVLAVVYPVENNGLQGYTHRTNGKQPLVMQNSHHLSLVGTSLSNSCRMWCRYTTTQSSQGYREHSEVSLDWSPTMPVLELISMANIKIRLEYYTIIT